MDKRDALLRGEDLKYLKGFRDGDRRLLSWLRTRASLTLIWVQSCWATRGLRGRRCSWRIAPVCRVCVASFYLWRLSLSGVIYDSEMVQCTDQNKGGTTACTHVVVDHFSGQWEGSSSPRRSAKLAGVAPVLCLNINGLSVWEAKYDWANCWNI